MQTNDWTKLRVFVGPHRQTRCWSQLIQSRCFFSSSEPEWSFYPRYSVASFTRRVGWMLRSIRIHPFRWLPQTAWRLSPFPCPPRCSDAFMHMHTPATPVILVRFSLSAVLFRSFKTTRLSAKNILTWLQDSASCYCHCISKLPVVCIYRTLTTGPYRLMHRRKQTARNSIAKFGSQGREHVLII